jgi:hypothetical protein
MWHVHIKADRGQHSFVSLAPTASFRALVKHLDSHAWAHCRPSPGGKVTGPLPDDATVDQPLDDDIEARDKQGSSADNQGSVVTHQTSLGHNVELPSLQMNDRLLSPGSLNSYHYYITKVSIIWDVRSCNM